MLRTISYKGNVAERYKFILNDGCFGVVRSKNLSGFSAEAVINEYRSRYLNTLPNLVYLYRNIKGFGNDTLLLKLRAELQTIFKKRKSPDFQFQHFLGIRAYVQSTYIT